MNYQERTRTRADVKDLYQRILQSPHIARYRGYTDTNSYGWSEEFDDYIKREGDVWFDNPAYNPIYDLAEEDSHDNDICHKCLNKGLGRCADCIEQGGDCDYRLPNPTDNVNHPSHYETGKFECIDVMIETQGVEAVKQFCLCNAFKYLYRHNGKNGVEDIKKARWYIDKYLELEGDQK
jgi:hypothetical protein